MSTPTDVTFMPSKPLNILHTSDWHLGRRLYGRLRYEEFDAFLSWLRDTISTKKVDILIVAGDIFDTMTPSNKAQALYYEFLGRVSQSCCQHIIIVAGNHDSPTFLDAPRQVLTFLNVHVIGTACADLNDEVLILEDTNGVPHCIIAAVPYLRDRDVRSSQAGESGQTKDANVIKGLCAHYTQVAQIAKTKQADVIDRYHRHIPIIATGHLFAAGSKTTDDDGVRDLYVGNLGQISADMFDDCFDYVALGHLHVPQRVGARESIRYSGSPIAMGFGEAKQQKQVLLVQLGKIDLTVSDKKITSDVDPNLLHHDKSGQMQIISLPIPTFQKLAQISGDLPTIHQTIEKTIHSLESTQTIWLEVIYTGDDIISELREQIQTMVEGLPCEVLKIKNTRTYNKVLNQQNSSETLQDLNVEQVFERCLTAHNISDEQKPSLRDAYHQIVYHLHHADIQAE